MNTPWNEGKLSELAQLVLTIGSDHSVQPTLLPCDYCTQDGHHANMCPYLQGGREQEQEMGSYYWSNQWSYDHPQHDQWWDNNQVWGNNQCQNPYQTWGNNQYQPTPWLQQPYPYPPQQTQTPNMSLEDIVKSLAISTQIFQQETQDRLKVLEQHVAQTAQYVSMLETQSQLPSQPDEKNFDDQRVLYEDEEEDEAEMEEVVKKVEEEVPEEVIEVNKIEVEPPTTNEEPIPMEDQPQEPEMINMPDLSKDTYPEKENAQPVTNSTNMSKMEELVILLNKYKKECGWIISIIKGLSPLWFPRKKKVKYKKRVPTEVWKSKIDNTGQICKVNGHRLKPFYEGFDSNVQDVVHLDAPKQ